MKGCRKFILFVLVILVLGIVAAAIGYVWLNNQIYTPVSSEATEVAFSVKAGESIDTIANNLATAKLIGNKDIFVLYVRLNKLGDDIKAGDFTLNPALNTAEIAQKLTEVVERPTTWITIKEGQRYSEFIVDLKTQLAGKAPNFDFNQFQQIIENPDQNLNLLDSEAQAFLTQYKPTDKNLEGFLYPDTYNVHTDIEPAELVSLLINTLDQKLTAEDKDAIRQSDRSFYQLLTLASILEWEANNEEDYKIVAGIMYNRMRQGMRLDVDAAVLYGLNRRTPEPTSSELANRNNLYNLRALPGLTPTPIGNSGIVTIRAALNPTTTDFLYYITGKDGKMYYAKTLTEHNRNIQRYL